ncbi:hypothetical protein [Pseudoramibacter alactolyticus]|uniref:hypothetical protein n=1 Tax=Pseudoramibacter alactolyticus TaxID=113287 RepID=UPI00235603A7|nr:hypothetical protein [Pseudoramibacter alactolyticus]MBM6968843.1 hypothetical protein [Pseudoramibacter alactolyticus]
MKLICTSREIPPKSNAHNGGYVLPMVLILLIFVLGIGTVLLMRAGNAVRLSRHYLDHSYCDTLVESARAECRARLEENPSYTGTGSWVALPDRGQYRINVTAGTSDTERRLVITARCGECQIKQKGTAVLDPQTRHVRVFSLVLAK